MDQYRIYYVLMVLGDSPESRYLIHFDLKVSILENLEIFFQKQNSNWDGFSEILGESLFFLNDEPISPDFKLSSDWLESNTRPVLDIRNRKTLIAGNVFVSSDKTKGKPNLAKRGLFSSSKPLGDILAESSFLDGFKGHTWHGKELIKCSGLDIFRLIEGKRKTKLNTSLSFWDQGICEPIDLEIRPRVIWEWPPKLTIPPPWSGFSILISVFVLAVISGMVFLFPKDPVQVSFVSSQECYIQVNQDRNLLNNDAECIFDLIPGRHKLVIYPKLNPIWETEILVNPLFPIKRMEFVLSPPRSNDSTLVGIEERENGSSPLEYSLFINGFSEVSENEKDATELMLPMGRYEIKYKNRNKIVYFRNARVNHMPIGATSLKDSVVVVDLLGVETSPRKQISIILEVGRE